MRATILLSTCVLGLVGGRAVAQPMAPGRKYTRPTTLTLGAPPSARTKPKPVTPASAPAPSLTPDELLAIQGDVSDIRDEQIELLHKLIAATPRTEVAELADLHFRLAEAYAQRDRYHRLASTKATIAADAATGPGDQRRLAAEAADHDRQARAALAAAIASYRELTDDDLFRDYVDLDKALFYLAYSLQRAQHAADARTVYHRLLTERPQSSFAPEAYLAFADYYFGAGELANALAFYQKVLRSPPSKITAYATYMLGWVDLDQHRAEDAGQQFLAVMRATAADPAQDVLHHAATKDFVRAFAEFGQVQKAWATFDKLDPGRAAPMVEILADLYVEQGKSERAVYAYRALLAQAPHDPHVCLWQYDVAQAMLATPGATLAAKVDEVVGLARLWQALRDRHALPAADASACHDDAAAMAGDLARAYHSEAIRTKDRATMAVAERLYDVDLAVVPDAADAGETQYYRAELLWSLADSEPDAKAQSARWEAAAVAFTDVARAGKVDVPLRKESAYAAVLGWKNALAVDPRATATPLALSADAGDRGGAVPAAQPIPAREQQMLAAFDLYLATVADPDDDERVGMEFLKARTLRRYGHFAEAVPLLEDLVLHHPGHETAYYAINTLFDLDILTHQYDQVARWAQYVADHPGFVTARADQDRRDLDARARELRMIGHRIAAEDCDAEAARTGDLRTYVACGNQYLTLFNDTVAADPAAGVKQKLDEILYDAGVSYEQGHSLSAAISVFQELRDRFPDSPVAAKALARLGAAYARVAYYDQASTMFEQYAKKYAGQGDAYQAMNDAVFYRKGIGDDDQAIANTTYFISKFGGTQPGDAAAAFFSLASIYEKRGDLDRVVKHYRGYLARYGDKGGADKVVVAYARIGQILWDQSCPVPTVDGSCIRVARERAVGSKVADLRRSGAATRTRCGDDTKLEVTPVARDPRKVKAALAAFAQAVAAYERRAGTLAPGDAYQARTFYALARFHQAEVDYEAFLRLAFPAGLDFDPGKPAEKTRSDARLASWLGEKKRLGAQATAAYGKLVFEVKDPTHAIAAAARIGQVSQNFSDALYTAEIPAFIRPYPDAVDAYCDQLTTVAEPYEAESIASFGACLKASTDVGWFSSWSRLCERELGQIEPGAFPTASELRAAPHAIEAGSDLEPAIATLE